MSSRPVGSTAILRRLCPAWCLALSITLAACSPAPESPAVAPSASAEPSVLTEAEVVATSPNRGACYRLSMAELLAPTSAEPATPCNRRWTARTIHVGPLDGAAAGQLVTADSDWAESLMAAECPRRLAEYLGGTARQTRLTVFRAVWFTPTVAETAAGADWFRCDLVALARPDRLARLTGSVRGLLADAERRTPYALCGTSSPDAPGFERVACAAEHTWRAVGSVDLAATAYPRPRAARRAAEQRCVEEARRLAADALDFTWGFEWPTRAQWTGTATSPGQRYGVCWAPADGS